jgi:hypothetical protein
MRSNPEKSIFKFKANFPMRSLYDGTLGEVETTNKSFAIILRLYEMHEISQQLTKFTF